MFSNEDIMNNEKLANVWKLAHGLEVSDEELKKANLPDICDELDSYINSELNNPCKRLSLRASAHLLAGCANMYKRQVSDLFKVVKEMNRLGMIVDLSHVGENTTRAAIRLSRAPVVFTHSSVYSLCNHKRNVPDDIIQSLEENGGIIMVNFFLTSPERDEMRTNGVEPEEHPDSPNDNGNCTSNAFYTEYV